MFFSEFCEGQWEIQIVEIWYLCSQNGHSNNGNLFFFHVKNLNLLLFHFHISFHFQTYFLKVLGKYIYMFFQSYNVNMSAIKNWWEIWSHKSFWKASCKPHVSELQSVVLVQWATEINSCFTTKNLLYLHIATKWS